MVVEIETRMALEAGASASDQKETSQPHVSSFSFFYESGGCSHTRAPGLDLDLRHFLSTHLPLRSRPRAVSLSARRARCIFTLFPLSLPQLALHRSFSVARS